MRTQHPLPVLLAVSVFVAGSSSTSFSADVLLDNNPESVRPIPKVGIEVSDADRKELEEGLGKLGKLLDELRPMGDPSQMFTRHRPDENLVQAWDRYADVAIFHRAVRVALSDQEFFEAKDIEAAKKLLTTGLERAEQLQAGESPWLKQKGLVVRGYISAIDHTPQPFGLVIPEVVNLDRPRVNRVDVWFHGRGETLSEVNFLTQRMTTVGPISPPRTIVLHPYGRYCNANKFAGETDTFETLDSLRRSHGIRSAARRVMVRGFSMGGAACWHFAVHHPSRWLAANPGAGFSETPQYLTSVKHETLAPFWWEEKLWRWYDCPGYVGNLKNLRVVAYSGEDDIQMQAADVMAAAYENAGMKLLHLIGPKTGHSIHPDSAKEIEAKLLEWNRGVSPKGLKHLEFVTYSLIYHDNRWVRLDGLKEHWEVGKVTADRTENGEIRVTTQNVTAMWLDFNSWMQDPAPEKLVIDGQSFDTKLLVENDPPATPRGFVPTSPDRFALENGVWKLQARRPSVAEEPVHKRHSVCGPIDHAFMGSFIFVKPSGHCAHPEVQAWVDAEMNRAITQWRRQFRGDARVKLDSDITDDDVHSANLVLWGDRASNSWIEKVAEKLPIQWDKSEITVGEQKFEAPHHALIAIYPNPLNATKYVVLNSGFTFREYDYLTNARQTPKLPDWAVVDLRTPPNNRWPGKIVAADFFDENWQLKPAKKVTTN